MVKSEIAKQIAEIYQKSKTSIDDKINFGSESDRKIYSVIKDVADGKYTC
jgi:hypothetical protein